MATWALRMVAGIVPSTPVRYGSLSSSEHVRRFAGSMSRQACGPNQPSNQIGEVFLLTTHCHCPVIAGLWSLSMRLSADQEELQHLWVKVAKAPLQRLSLP